MGFYFFFNFVFLPNFSGWILVASKQQKNPSGGNESLTEVADCNPMPGFAAPAACGPVKVMKAGWADSIRIATNGHRNC